MGKGLVIAATHSGAGKSLISMALLRVFRRQKLKMAAAKVGPDYIDGAFHALAMGDICYNYDLWAMADGALNMVEQHLALADLALVEGVLGLFDGPIKGVGSTADVAAKLNLPVILVVDAGAMAQSVAALIYGFKNFRPDVNLTAVIFNNIGSERHKKMLEAAVEPLNIPVIGCLPRHQQMVLPSRHLGLVQANEMPDFNGFVDKAADYIMQHLNLDLLLSLATDLDIKAAKTDFALKPLAQHIAIAKDAAFTFHYGHIFAQWRKMGAELSFFSPLNDELPNDDANAVFLSGGYPELFAAELASKDGLRTKLQKMSASDCMIYGECGGYMVMGEGLVDRHGKCHQMFGLLDLVTSFETPKRHLGYRKLSHQSQLPWQADLFGHEFHYTHAIKANGTPLFNATDASGCELGVMGLQNGKILGSYAHVIDVKGHND